MSPHGHHHHNLAHNNANLSELTGPPEHNYGERETLIGHLVPGSIFALHGIFSTISILQRYFQSRYLKKAYVNK